ncbi:MAG: RNA methyltransferase [Pseudomonadota bacterium]
MSDLTPGPARPRRHERRRFLTVYGRNAVLEALQDPQLACRTLHLASSNRPNAGIRQLRRAATDRGTAICEHSREELARISRNGKQDQGVALDVFCPRLRELDSCIDNELAAPKQRLLAFDGVTNPQNVGMALRSATAAGIDGILYADRGNPRLGPLVIKASAGTVFRAPLLRCETVLGGLELLLDRGFDLYRLSAEGTRSLFELDAMNKSAVFVLGGESDGVSDAVARLPGVDLSIPMAAGVESLNVAVSAALLAYQVTR